MMLWYRPILALHVIAIISWMAGILYLYRLLIYQSERGTGSREVSSLLALMSRRLYRYITLPAMVVSWIAGLTMTTMQPALWGQGWFQVKFAAILALTGTTFYAGRLVGISQDSPTSLPKGKTLRYLNELPTVLMIIIVIMVITKPLL